MAMWIPKSSAEKQRRLVLENMLLRERFPFLHTRIVGNRLVSRGNLKPTPTSQTYRLELEFQPWNAPALRVLDPEIKPEPKLHFYSDGTLCLYDWREQPWQKNWHLTDTVIPWAAEWFVYYEIYLLTGQWLGRSAVHGGATKAAEPQPNNDEVKERAE